jgi:ankyrin repeat protein
MPSAPGVPFDITTRDPEGRTPLHLAAFFNYPVMVRKMLQQQADVSARDNEQRTPGHWPAFKGHLDVIKMLLEFGADLNARDTAGRTLLRMAIIGRQSLTEEFLRVHGAVL